jgi:SnoaL-like domain
MSPSTEAQLQQLLDREAIREAVYAYCRGIDRGDEAALRSSYWPDGTDQHGAYSGSAAGFIDVALKTRASGLRMIHHVTNISIVLKGSQAAVETYFQAFQCDFDQEQKLRETFLCGRYVDRFSNRGDEWRVEARTVVYDWIKEAEGSAVSESDRFGPRKPVGGMKPDDPWYALLAQAPFSG